MGGRAPRTSGLTVISVAIVLMFAGCTDGSQPASDDAQDGPPTTANDSATDGVIRGVVSDDEALPVAGANLSIGTSGIEVVTNADGTYQAEGVPAGAHAVAVLADGFQPAARQVDVAPGSVAWANFTLDPLPTTEPYAEVLPRTAFVDFAQRQLNILVLNQLNQTCQNCKHPIFLDEEPYDLRTEFSFEPTINYPVGSTKVCADYYRNYTGDNPFVEGEFVANACLEDRGNDTLQRDPDPACSNCVRTPTDQITLYIVGQEPFDCVGCAPNVPVIQQRVDIWFSIGHHAPLPPGWTALPPEE